MECDDRYLAITKGTLLKDNTVAAENIYVPCGKCKPCKLKRVQHWVFRLQQEERRSSSSYFITLTYDTRHVPITPKKFMTLDRTAFPSFMKRLRNYDKSVKIKYYAVGEYGDEKERPHYHAIIFNTTPDNIHKAWTFGKIDIDQVNTNTIAYTCKYIDKEKKIPKHQNDDRIREFSLMSKNLGDNYLSPAIISHFKKDITNQVVHFNGHRISMPRYYRKKLYNKAESTKYIRYVKDLKQQQAIAEEKAYYADPNNTLPYEVYLSDQKAGRSLNSKTKSRKDL